MYVDSITLQNRNVLQPLLVRSPGGRSGTSLMMEILSSTDEIAFDRRHPYEVRMLSYFFRQSFAMFAKKNDSWSNDMLVRGELNSIGPIPVKTDLIKDKQDFTQKHFFSSWELFSHDVIAEYKKNENTIPRFYAEKVPHDILPSISKFIECKKIYLIRDPRAEFSSIIGFNKKRNTNLFGWSEADTIESFSEKFVKSRKAYFEMLANLKLGDENIIIKYEEMITNPQQVCEKLNSFLNVRVTTAEVEKNFDANLKHMTSSTPKNSLDKWKKHLPESTVDYLSDNLLSDNNFYI